MAGPKILITDDADDQVDFIIYHLKTIFSDVSFLRARNSSEAVNKANQNNPDLILLNSELPDSSGFETVRRLKKEDVTKDIPVIIISEIPNPELVRLTLDSGAIDYMKKPIDPNKLKFRTKTALKLSATLQQLKIQKEKLEEEKKKSDILLNGLLPSEIIETMKISGSINPRRFENVTVIIGDLVDFTLKSQKMSPQKLLDELQIIFSAFDQISSHYHCTRIKTVGDAYVVVSGMWNNQKDHALIAAKMAERMREAIIEINKKHLTKWEIRIGINSGDIIAGIINQTNLSFDIFGDTVNTASRMQKYCNPMQINVSQSTYNYIYPFYTMIKRISRKVKGKGAINMYYIHKPNMSGEQEIEMRDER